MAIASLPASAWDEKKAGVLLQRAGFGGTPKEVAFLAAMQPWQAVDFLLGSPDLGQADPPPSILKPSLNDKFRTERNRLRQVNTPDAEKKRQEILRVLRMEQEKRLTDLRGWWLSRMADPALAAREKMVLFLHGHFATSEEKVKNPALLYQQNRMFRQMALGSWSDLVLGVAKDPAMLIYLDGARSRPEQPNENFARELFELFTLGEGHYTEKDVQEAARAFTGWSIRLRPKPGEAMDEESHVPSFMERPVWHDSKSKKIFGKTGNFDGADVVRLTLQQPAASRWITGKLWRFYAGNQPDEALHQELVQAWDENKGLMRPFLQAMWTHPAFYAPKLARQRVKSPVEWLVGLCRQLERPLPAPALASEITTQLGQKLFAPPNVKGWDGGITWINTASLQRRYEYGGWIIRGTQGARDLAGMDWGRLAMQSGLVELPTAGIGGDMTAQPGQKKEFARQRRAAAARARELFTIPPLPAEKLAAQPDRQDPDRLVAILANRLLPGESIPPELLRRFRQVASGTTPLNDTAVRDTALAMIQSPVYQLG